MIVYRAAKDAFARDLSGQGARQAGGRWNSRGIPMLYTAENKPLCMFELMVHIPVHLLPRNYKIVIIEIPNAAPLQEIKLKDLPVNWNSLPFTSSTQEIGNKFVKGNKLVLKVPSAVVPESFNYLINPLHRDINGVKIVSVDDFYLDPRLL